MIEDPIPTGEEVKNWLLFTLQHSCHVEYFLGKLKLGKNDLERPHDLVGPGNKYDWDVIKGFALQNRTPPEEFEKYILSALKLHRQQYHHQKWNYSDVGVKSTKDDFLAGAVDAVSSLLENRKYQGGAHNYQEVVEIARFSLPHNNYWMLKIIPEMKKLEQPNLEQIVSLNEFPNIGLSEKMYDLIANRTNETVEKLKIERGYLL